MTGRWRPEQLCQGLFSAWDRGTNTAEGILLGLSGVQFILIQTPKGSLPEQCHVALRVSPILLIQKGHLGNLSHEQILAKPILIQLQTSMPQLHFPLCTSWHSVEQHRMVIGSVKAGVLGLPAPPQDCLLTSDFMPGHLLFPLSSW